MAKTKYTHEQVNKWLVKNGFQYCNFRSPKYDGQDTICSMCPIPPSAMTPMALAAFEGDLLMCKFLAENGAKEDVTFKFDVNSETLMDEMWEAYHAGSKEETGDDEDSDEEEPSDELPYIGGDGRTPAHWAACNGNLDVLMWLCESGASASLNQMSGYGETPFKMACDGGHMKTCQELVMRGALKPNTTNDDRTSRSMIIMAMTSCYMGGRIEISYETKGAFDHLSEWSRSVVRATDVFKAFLAGTLVRHEQARRRSARVAPKKCVVPRLKEDQLRVIAGYLGVVGNPQRLANVRTLHGVLSELRMRPLPKASDPFWGGVYNREDM